MEEDLFVVTLIFLRMSGPKLSDISGSELVGYQYMRTDNRVISIGDGVNEIIACNVISGDCEIK